jgi:hypothetical protein
LIVVAGDDPWDFALFYALRRMTGIAYWLPSVYRESRQAVMALAGAIKEFNPEQVVVTTAESEHDLAPAADALRPWLFRVDEIPSISWPELIPAQPRRLLARDNYGVPQGLLLDTGRSGYLPTPVPTTRTTREHETRWMTDVRVEGWQPILSPQLGPHVLEAPSYGTTVTRTTREGAAYFCPHFMWFGGDLEGQTVRPRLHRRGLLDQIRHILGVREWRCDPSDKGIYGQQSAKLFGGLPELAAALTDDTWNRFFSAFRAGDRGLALKDQRTYLPIADLLDAVAGKWTEDDVQNAVARGIVGRGLIHKCPVCRWASWYGQEEIGGDLRCARCRERADLGDTDWLGNGEPRWFYRLSEVLWQFLGANGDLPIRGIFQELWRPDRVMAATPELDLWPPDAERPIEIDICVQRGPELWIGEAKIADRLGTAKDENAKLAKLAEAANVLGAHGVLFVTAAPEFRDATKARILATFPEGSLPRALIASAPTRTDS